MQIGSYGALCVSLLMGAAALYAAEVWNAKDPAQWSDQDVNRILNDSPWAKQVNVSAGGPVAQRQRGGGGRMGGGGYPGGGGNTGGVNGPMGGGFPGGGGGRGGNGYPGAGGNGGGYPGAGGDSGGSRTQSFPVTVRWESALPVRLARHRSSNSEAADQPEKDYVIAVAGMPMQSASDRSRDPDQVREELMEMTMLDRRGKTALRPSDVKLDSGDGQVRFFFHRDQPLDLDDREVTFQTNLGQMKLEKKFRLKDMEYKGKLEL
jgi:hypothetical protein